MACLMFSACDDQPIPDFLSALLMSARFGRTVQCDAADVGGACAGEQARLPASCALGTRSLAVTSHTCGSAFERSDEVRALPPVRVMEGALRRRR